MGYRPVVGPALNSHLPLHAFTAEAPMVDTVVSQNPQWRVQSPDPAGRGIEPLTKALFPVFMPYDLGIATHAIDH